MIKRKKKNLFGKKFKIIGKRFAVVGVVCMLLSVSILGAKAIDNGFSWSDVEELLANRLYSETQQADVAGGTGETHSRRVYTGLYDLTLKDADSSEGSLNLVRQQFSGTFGTASSTFLSIQNDSNYPWLVKEMRMQLFTDGVSGSSGTVRFSAGTSSLAYHTDYNDTTDPTQLFNVAFATGTYNGAFYASGTPNAPGLVSLRADGNDATSTERFNWLVVQPGEYIIGLQQAFDPSKVSVTSTATGDGRGYTSASWYLLDILTHATST